MSRRWQISQFCEDLAEPPVGTSDRELERVTTLNEIGYGLPWGMDGWDLRADRVLVARSLPESRLFVECGPMALRRRAATLLGLVYMRRLFGDLVLELIRARELIREVGNTEVDGNCPACGREEHLETCVVKRAKEWGT